MTTLMKSPKKRSLANTNAGLSGTFPTWSSWMDELLNNDLPSVFQSNFNTGMSLPKVNISETDDAYEVELAAPGMKKDDFNIEIDNQVLTISSEMENEEETKENNYTRREFGYSSFKRSFTLPESVDDGKIKAKYNEGILNIELPKREEAKKKPARSIKIS
ncbi:Hsp20/alpha crystallin family protein [Marixanthomonas spongiae]|uniref:Heat-shock protein n=1 Tax=Marixanthomonas spongiae TaxID=2174845 RepID=A0A2U0HW21_9FLAO|nr:heat-shock protein [Marixanthomonas spongiae]